MLNAIVAGLLFCVFIYLCTKLIPLIPDSPWGDEETFRFVALTSSILGAGMMLISAAANFAACGSLGTLLLYWAVDLVGIVLFVSGILIMTSVVDSVVEYVTTKTQATNISKKLREHPAAPYLQRLLLVVLILGTFAFLGSMSLPNCEAPQENPHKIAIKHLCENLSGENLEQFEVLHNCE